MKSSQANCFVGVE